MTDPSQPSTLCRERISIVIPSFNQAEYLDEAIASVISQNHPDIELIVMDGGSQDGSLAVIQKYVDKLAYWQSKPDGGQARAIADGFLRATGSIFGWLNSDDRLVQGALEAVAEAFADEKITWIFGDSEIIDSNSRVMDIRRTAPVDIFDLVNLRYYLPQESSFFRRSLYFESNGLDPNLDYAMDYALWLTFATISSPSHIPKVLGSFRFRPGQKSDDKVAYRAEEDNVKDSYSEYRLPVPLRLRRFCRLNWSILRRRLGNEGSRSLVRKQVRALSGQNPKLGYSTAAARGIVVLGVLGLLGLRHIVRNYWRRGVAHQIWGGPALKAK
jgi:glycosyltransferase involved in cell wall biosynthesis